jgi:NAD-dependent deacetylase
LNLFILTGAGISADSGLATWREGSGLWHGQTIEQICSVDAFQKIPDLVCAFYDERRAAALKAAPNPAHHALAKLERIWTEQSLGECALVTQNIDDLHERAGSPSVIHMHGALHEAMCAECGWQGLRYSNLEGARDCALCGVEALRPNIVFFGEAPRHMRRIEAALQSCDIFVSIGTSGAVYPAAGFAQIAAQNGASTVHMNTDDPAASTLFGVTMKGRAADLAPIWVDELLTLKLA